MDYSKLSKYCRLLDIEEVNLSKQIAKLNREIQQFQHIIDLKRTYRAILKYIHQRIFDTAERGETIVKINISTSSLPGDCDDISEKRDRLSNVLRQVGMQNFTIGDLSTDDRTEIKDDTLITIRIA
jgi:hypothetical protein